jgi:hypothetical protein
LFNDLQTLLALLIILVETYLLLRRSWLNICFRTRNSQLAAKTTCLAVSRLMQGLFQFCPFEERGSDDYLMLPLDLKIISTIQEII